MSDPMSCPLLGLCFVYEMSKNNKTKHFNLTESCHQLGISTPTNTSGWYSMVLVREESVSCLFTLSIQYPMVFRESRRCHDAATLVGQAHAWMHFQRSSCLAGEGFLEGKKLTVWLDWWIGQVSISGSTMYEIHMEDSHQKAPFPTNSSEGLFGCLRPEPVTFTIRLHQDLPKWIAFTLPFAPLSSELLFNPPKYT